MVVLAGTSSPIVATTVRWYLCSTYTHTNLSSLITLYCHPSRFITITNSVSGRPLAGFMIGHRATTVTHNKQLPEIHIIFSCKQPSTRIGNQIALVELIRLNVIQMNRKHPRGRTSIKSQATIPRARTESKKRSVWSTNARQRSGTGVAKSKRVK